MISSSFPAELVAITIPGSSGSGVSGPNVSETLRPLPLTVARPEMNVTVGLARLEHVPNALSVPEATSPSTSMRRRVGRFCGTPAATGSTVPPRPVSDVQAAPGGGGAGAGPGSGGGGCGGGGGVPSLPGPFANAVAPCEGPVSESATPEWLQELTTSAASSAAADRSTGRRDGECVVNRF